LRSPPHPAQIEETAIFTGNLAFLPPAVLGPERVAVLTDQARVRFHAAA
jgi:hypothetical protein